MLKKTFAIALILAGVPLRAQDVGPVRFEVRLSKQAAQAPVSGRMLIMMTNAGGRVNHIRAGFGGMFGGAAVYTAAQEVTNLEPGGSVVVNPDALAYPAAFSFAPKGAWQVMALLDVDHSYARSEEGPGDITSEVVRLAALDPARANVVSLTLATVNPMASRRAAPGISQVSFTSPVLSRFWGRPITMRATVVLPEGSGRHYPTVYHVPGFGSDDSAAWSLGPSLRTLMVQGKIPAMVHVFLDPQTPLGHSEFADSVNNGPWGAALTREFIPFLERQFPLVAAPRGRFLTGHSSGGWSTLWLQLSYPDYFDGTWSTGPDPVDFRSFSGADITGNPPENVYLTIFGEPRNIVRLGGKNVMSFRDFARYEAVAGDYGGQMASFEAVFSPKGPDGRPMRLFDRATGAVDPFVARAWRKYDIHRVLVAGGKPLLARLRGKIHVTVGAADNFHLEEAIVLLRDYLMSVGSDAVVTVVPGRDHMNLYADDLENRILREMGRRWAATR